MLWAAFLVLTAVLIGCLLSIRRQPRVALSLPLVAIFLFAYLYLISPLYLYFSGDLALFLSDTQAVKGVLIPALMLPSFVAGWNSPRRPRAPRRSHFAWSPSTLFRWGLFTASAGFVLFFIFILRSGGVQHFYSEPHGTAGAWETNTAYLYMSPKWLLSGAVLMMLGTVKLRNTWATRIAIAPLAVIYAHAILTGGRGPFFAATACWFAGACLAKKRIPPLSKALLLLAFTALGVALLLGYRNFLHLGDGPREAPSLSTALAAPVTLDDSARAQRNTGMEFIYHALTIDTVDATQKYQLGAHWIYTVTVHLIPRVIWPDKPYTFTGWGITSDDIAAHTGVTIAGGAAAGLVGETYRNLGLFACLLLYALGKLTRRLYIQAWDADSPFATHAYVILYSLSLYLFAQGIEAVIAQYLYALAPVAALALLAKRDRVTAPQPHPRPARREVLLVLPKGIQRAS